MKTFTLIATLLLSSVSFAKNKSCSWAIENHFRAQGYQVRLVQFQKELDGGEKVYHVRTNYWGGDAASEVTTSPKCEILDVRELWSE